MKKTINNKSTASENPNSDPGANMPLGKLIIRTAPNKTGISKSVDILVNRPMIIKNPPNKWSQVITSGNHSFVAPKFVSVNIDSRCTESLINEIPFRIRHMPKMTLKKTSHLG